MKHPTADEILARMGDAPAALVGDFLLCRNLLRNGKAVAGLLAVSSEPTDTVTPVSAETIAAEGYFCGSYHGDCLASA